MVKLLTYRHLGQNDVSESVICAVDQLRSALVKFSRVRATSNKRVICP